MKNDPPAGLYIHTPFCKTRCRYCDFYSITNPELIDAWVRAVIREAEMYKNSFSIFESFFLGGGTPSFLSAFQLAELMDGIRSVCKFASQCEVTIEVNPDDVSENFLSTCRSLGFNRISLGVQSLSDRELSVLGRRHNAKQVDTAIRLTRKSGFANLSVDLIFGYTAQSPVSWESTLNKLLQYQPEHVSCYQMTETNGKHLPATNLPLKPVSEQLQRAFYLQTAQILKKRGYHHYEISNFAREEKWVCHHNMGYWDRRPYLGLGPSAHSFRNEKRWWNLKNVEKYCERIAAGEPPVSDSEVLSPEQQRMERLSLGFRTAKGVSVREFLPNTRNKNIIARLIGNGLLNRRKEFLVPTTEGYLVADSLPLEFL